MFEPIRGGTRGGQAEFKWSDVSADKDRENYLGHSINAPTGRWQKNKDIHWYNRELKQTEEERQAEIRKIKEAEENALAVALGFTPTVKNSNATNNNAAENTTGKSPLADDAVGEQEKAERRQRKLERRLRKEEKKARKDASKTGLINHHRTVREVSPQSRSRSRSPLRRPHTVHNHDEISPRRVELHSRRSPIPWRRDSVSKDAVYYDREERERERERDRRRWDANGRNQAEYSRGRR